MIGSNGKRVRSGRCAIRWTAARAQVAGGARGVVGDPGWAPYDSQQRLVQIFDANPVVTDYPEKISRRLWSGHRFQALPLLTA